ncbi:hypothetical protein [Zavarzinella formosa]|uniref:hypothetical protein n=1 Tax=Zavarzinella formosa TaxID=360055 RepID=UPI0002F99453|nr:hypothetical protein [Zavarzinella formosa]
MKRNDLYRQCRLIKRIRDGERILMSQHSADFAKVSRVAKFEEESGNWDVSLVGGAINDTQLDENQLAHRRFKRETSND